MTARWFGFLVACATVAACSNKIQTHDLDVGTTGFVITVPTHCDKPGKGEHMDWEVRYELGGRPCAEVQLNDQPMPDAEQAVTYCEKSFLGVTATRPGGGLVLSCEHTEKSGTDRIYTVDAWFPAADGRKKIECQSETTNEPMGGCGTLRKK